MLANLIGMLLQRRVLLPLVLLSIAVFGGIVLLLDQLAVVSGGRGIPDFEFGYDRDQIDGMFASYGEEGRRIYARILWLDLLNPALYSLVFVALSAAVLGRKGPAWLPLLALAGGIGDYAENFVLWRALAAYPNIPEGLIETGSILSYTKYALILLALIPMIWGILFRLNGTRTTSS